MSSFVFANNINTTLASAASSSSTTLTLASATGLPSLSAGQIMPLTLNDASTGLVYEIVYVTAISGVTLTVTRAQEGTGAQNWSIGDYAFAAITAGPLNAPAYPNSPTMPTPAAGDKTTKGATTAYASMTGGVVGSSRNLRALLTTAGTSLTVTADEIIVESALGGSPFRLASFNATLNVATTGADGMDTGAAPASGYVAIYAIYNPSTSTAALLATNATAAAAPNIYGGANMPAGYTLSGLISVWTTDGSGQLAPGLQKDRAISVNRITAISTTPPTTYTAVALPVPLNARRVAGTIECYLASGTSSISPAAIYVSPAGSILGEQVVAGYIPAAGSSVWGYFSMDLTTAQTIYWYGATTFTGSIYLSSYEI